MDLPEEVKIFLIESYENLDGVERDLLSLEKSPSNVELLNSVFRAVHTLKGNSGFLGLSSLEQACHKGEGLLDQLRTGRLSLNQSINSDLLALIDWVRSALQQVEETGLDSTLDGSELLKRIALHMPRT
jgi:two-component system chemotaxis sensor kinase CheA